MEPKVTPESGETLHKLDEGQPLTNHEIERIRKNFIAEDNRTWAKQYAYNFITKSAIILTSLVSIFGALSFFKGWIKL